MYRRVALRFALLFVVVAAAPIGTVGVASAAQNAPTAESAGLLAATEATNETVASSTATQAAVETLEVHYEVAATPDRPGAVRVTLTPEIPSSVTKLRLNLNANHTVTSDVGFSQTDTDANRWTWTGEPSNPRITYVAQLNRSNGRAAAGGFEEVDTGEWVLTSHRPQTVGVTFKYWYRGGEVRSAERISPAGTGFAGVNLLFLGDHRVVTRTANGQTFRLIIPDAADMTAEPEQVLDALAVASNAIRFGQRDEAVNVFVAPDPIRRGGGTWWYTARDQQDVWVNEREAVGIPDDTWVHEYVHTRRDYKTSEEMAWVDEANAEYYAALVGLNRGNVSFAQFRDHVVTKRYADDALTRPTEWSSGHVEYRKGTHVLGALDATIRRATGGNRTLQHVFQRMASEDRITADAFADIVAAVAGEQLDDWLERYVEGGELPTVPADQHRFVLGAAVDADGDGLSNGDEMARGTKPFAVDSDGDGLADGAEVNEYGTDPTMADTDDDGLTDGAEVNEHGTNPAVDDSDDDGLPDGEEVELGTDPLARDTDGDGLADGVEVNEYGTNPTRIDTDGDGLDDAAELDRGTDPTAADTDGDGIADGREVELGTNPTVETGALERYWSLVAVRLATLFS